MINTCNHAPRENQHYNFFEKIAAIFQRQRATIAKPYSELITNNPVNWELPQRPMQTSSKFKELLLGKLRANKA